MDLDIAGFRQRTVEKILARQDASFRWGYDEKQARARPDYLYYSPNFRSTLWTLLLLADIQAPVDIPRIEPSLRLVNERFYDPEYGIFRLPGMSHFPIPCLNGNMLYLNHYFKASRPDTVEKTVGFFAATQRFDDGGSASPGSHPYSSNTSCYGRHTCYWGVTKLLKGISFIPKPQRSAQAQRLLDNCIAFVLQHEVCFRSHAGDEFLHRDIGRLTFPNFYKSDFLEILWLLAREGVHDAKMSRSLDLLLSRMKDCGTWELEKSLNIVEPIGRPGCANPFITERAAAVLDYYGR